MAWSGMVWSGRVWHDKGKSTIPDIAWFGVARRGGAGYSKAKEIDEMGAGAFSHVMQFREYRS